MNIATLEKANRVVPNLEAFRLLGGNGFELIHLTLAIGEEQTMHANPYRVVFYVLEGQGVLKLQDEKLQLFKDNCVEVVPEILRCWENAWEQPLKLLVIKFLE